MPSQPRTSLSTRHLMPSLPKGCVPHVNVCATCLAHPFFRLRMAFSSLTEALDLRSVGEEAEQDLQANKASLQQGPAVRDGPSSRTWLVLPKLQTTVSLMPLHPS